MVAIPKVDHLVAAAAPRTPERRALRAAGWLPIPCLGPRLTVRLLGGDLRPDPTRMRSWRPSIGDLEIF